MLKDLVSTALMLGLFLAIAYAIRKGWNLGGR